MAKSDPDLVIIGHDHEPGYGEGYYIATPTMDNASVDLAEEVTGDIGFNLFMKFQKQIQKPLHLLNPIGCWRHLIIIWSINE